MSKKKGPVLVELMLDQIEATAATQIRIAIDKETVENYAEAMKAREPFPPLVVFAEKGSQRYILADGFHRQPAAELAGLVSFYCELHEGGLHDALRYALSANHTHGLPRSRRDKRNAVEFALKDPEWSGWNNTEISRLCRVSDKLVAKVREDLIVSGEIEEPDTVKTTRGGKTVERKANRASSENSDERDSSEKSATSKNGPKTMDEVNRADVQAALDAIKAIPHDGEEAAERWGDQIYTDAKYCSDWLEEYLQAFDT